MEKIQSFTIDHMILVPGIYVSRVDYIGPSREPVTTFGLRLVRPNFDEPMDPAAVHTIEHIGATFLRNNPAIKESLIYFGPMGCLTGFYLILAGEYNYSIDKPEYMKFVNIVIDMMRFIVRFNDIIPGYSPVECGNYTFHDLSQAKNIAGNFLVLYDTMGALLYEYPTHENNPGICMATSVNGTDKLSKAAKNAHDTMFYRDASAQIAFDIPDSGNYVKPIAAQTTIEQKQQRQQEPAITIDSSTKNQEPPQHTYTPVPNKVESYSLF